MLRAQKRLGPGVLGYYCGYSIQSLLIIFYHQDRFLVLLLSLSPHWKFYFPPEKMSGTDSFNLFCTLLGHKKSLQIPPELCSLNPNVPLCPYPARRPLPSFIISNFCFQFLGRLPLSCQTIVEQECGEYIKYVITV